jgi:hypothetical protein
MNSQLHVGSSPGYYLNAAIVDNAGSVPTVSSSFAPARAIIRIIFRAFAMPLLG